MNNFFLPLKVNVHLTNYCSYECDYCFFKEKKELNKEKMSLEIIDKIIFFMKYYKVPLVSICGGDPLLSENFLYLSEELLKNKNYIVVATNANNLTFDYVKKMKKIGIRYLQIGIDRISNLKEINYKEDGHILKMLKSIEKLKKVGIKYGIATCVTKENIAELFEVVNFAKKNGAELLKISFYIGNIPKYKLKNDEKEKLLNKIKKYNKKNENYIKTNLIEESLHYSSKYPTITITTVGEVLVEENNLKLGNIMDDDIGKLYYNYIKELK